MKTNFAITFTSHNHSIESCVNVIDMLERLIQNKHRVMAYHNNVWLYENIDFEERVPQSLLMHLQPEFMECLNSLCYEILQHEEIKEKLTPLIHQSDDDRTQHLLRIVIDDSTPTKCSAHKMYEILLYLLMTTDYNLLPYDFLWYLQNTDALADGVKICYDKYSNSIDEYRYTERYMSSYWRNIFI